MASACVRRFCQKRTFLVIQHYKLSKNLARSLSCACNIQNFSAQHDERVTSKSKFRWLPTPCLSARPFSDDKKTEAPQEKETKQPQPGKKLSIFQQFKQMYKDYWYVLVPVHIVTSAAWFGGFYYLAKSGVDVVALLETMHISDRIINPLRDSSLGYIAASYALYKVATPIRYMVTVGGTTVSIKYLKEWGYIKPVPSREQLKEIYKEKILVSVREKRDEFIQRKDQLKDKTDALVDSIKKVKETGELKDKAKLLNELEEKFNQSKEEFSIGKQKLTEHIEKIKNAKD